MSPAKSRRERSSIPLTSQAPGLSRRLARPAVAALLSLNTLWLAACGGGGGAGDDASSKKDQGDFVTEWEPGADGLARIIRQEKLIEDLAEALNDGFKLPRDLPIVHAFCNEPNAYYDSSQRVLVMCYEMLDLVTSISLDLSADEEEAVVRAISTWTFIFFHELGHGLVHLYDIPTTGREEDAVDDFSTLLMIEAGLIQEVAYAADFWLAIDTGVMDDSQYADEHSLNQQRFYNMLCLIYGSDPNRLDFLVSDGYLPESRAVRCPGEYAQKRKSWETLLEPWSKD
jgi:Putative metallopeptidase